MTNDDANKSTRWDTALCSALAGLVLLTILQMLAGITLNYDPDIDQAYTLARRTRSWVPMLAGFHYWGSSILIAGSFALLAILFVTGRYARESRALWFGTLGLFVLSYLFQLTGNVLPMDRHDVQTVVVEASIAARAPVVGPAAAELMLQGDRFGQPTLAAWHSVHIGLSILALVLFATLFRTMKKAKVIWPEFYLPAVVALLLGLAVRSPLGEPAGSADFTSFDAQVSWYTWPLHGMLRAFESISPNLGWVGAIVVPKLFLLFLVALPFVGPRLGRRVSLAIGATFAGAFAIAAVLFGGRFAPLTGSQDPTKRERTVSEVPATPVDSALVAEGKKLFSQQGCVGCHGIDGSKSAAGPDLTKVHVEHPDRDWYKAFIKEPKSVNPDSTMPPFPDLLDAELEALAEYLRAPR